MKKEYQNPTLETIDLRDVDIVTASGMCQGDTTLEGPCEFNG